MLLGQALAGEPCVSLVPLFAGLTREQQADVATLARPVTVVPGRDLRSGWRGADALFVVHSGMVKVSHTTADGKCTTLQVLGPGEVGGQTAPRRRSARERRGRAGGFADVRLPAGRARHHCPAVPGRRGRPLRSLAVRLHSAERMLTARTLADVGARLAAYLLDCPTTWGVGGTATAHLPMAKKDIATFLGTSPETVSRRLRAFEHEGLVQVRGMDVDIRDALGLELRARGA